VKVDHDRRQQQQVRDGPVTSGSGIGEFYFSWGTIGARAEADSSGS
jgi:hypothetical protein